ncbi:ribosome biogenesis protein NOC4 [Ceratobasidium sp. AG-Ba]|nr:ribosome biogenesis protein NOC4 [Ceratobasidium sp. AG-Ba]
MPTPSSLPPPKKRKLSSSDDTVKRIESLESSLAQSLLSGGSLNAFVDLLELARSTTDAAVLHKIIYALYRSMVSIAASPKLDAPNAERKKVNSRRKGAAQRRAADTHVRPQALVQCLLERFDTPQIYSVTSGRLSVPCERLKTMPTEIGELNAFWIPEFGTKPPKPTRGSKQLDDDQGEAIPVDEDDWRTFFDDGGEVPPKSSKANAPRVHTLSTHQSLYSLSSHRAQFSACWMALLPHIASSGPLATRALSVMHRGVMPHMDKPVRLMDWVGGCVDFGGSIGLLALNALFVLIKDYNLQVPSL